MVAKTRIAEQNVAMLKSRTSPAPALAALLVLLSGCTLFGDSEDDANSRMHGAIAYSNLTGRWSIATERPDPETARRDAIQACAETDCRQVLAFGPRHCGAIAPGAIGRPGLAIARKVDRAEAAAKNFCEQQGGGDCEEVTSACNP